MHMWPHCSRRHCGARRFTRPAQHILLNQCDAWTGGVLNETRRREGQERAWIGTQHVLFCDGRCREDAAGCYPSTALVCRLVADEARVLVLSRRGDDDEVLRKRREHTKRVDGVDAGRDVLLRDRGVVQEDVQALLGVAVLLAERLERADHVVELEQVGVRVAPREPLVADERDGVLGDESDELVVVVHVHEETLFARVLVGGDLAHGLEALEVDHVQ
eukprot:5955477-Prymnesium_polylepis.1